MKNVFTVLTIAAVALGALLLAGGGTESTGAALPPPPASSELAAGPVAQWEYRVVSTRAALMRAGARSGSRNETTTGGGDPNVRLIAWRAAEADALRAVERELNRLGGEGWEMCSASDGAMVFRRALSTRGGQGRPAGQE
jgi:hypothetical protein